MDLSQEIANHLEWMDTVASLINNEKFSEEDLQEISSHDKCDLGQWMESEASQALHGLDEFQKLIESHEAFHKLAGKLIELYQQGKESETLEVEEQFIHMSQEVITHLQMLEETTRNNS